ncbi:hypothetical protein VF14_19610 [Nostoc linckia z18]|uniref:Uncharacterized protein n=2 Tax=Nostoc linckia TaxID=92942 RepID=A0A9Q5ZB51_NOSLI|nr:hypothetical protein VF02_18990 [Nostoc linckia z1]PHJ65605.1 hypothetical protein VF05_20755 [Nostoc linckia z3]PHJ66676.1 hypothetical protein VF03_26600 [Nostoc linckia z2]PHJ77076.1 hypothetical protein VF06_30640 [Nostoc linckia z4]PHJ91065.1 hypothetical protein VF07_07135 [Nostoc linckia z6]PHJ94512.1 hypothetical protein VF04_22325 [Nostoc linckia z7]PHK02634.1 hypothetical protein VF08_17990 [Nostoc linckia z8]PHK09832.1 hypothetical protein VF09_13700 [Nostoc linckia z9]PHK1708
MLLVILVKLYKFWILDFEFWINSKLISQADSMSLGFFYQTEFRSQEPEFRMNYVRVVDE